MGNIADSKIKKASKHWDISDSEDAINFVTSYRNELSYSKHTKDIVNLITMKEGFPGAIVGSGKFRAQSYPGDIDLMEKIEMCCSKRDIARFVTERLQRIARDIKESEHVYLGDFKAGLDKRYQLNYGFINLNYKLVGYNRKQIVNQLSRMRGDGLFTKRQYDGLIELLPPNARDRHIHQWEKFRDAYRKYFVVRWSIDAVIRGYKNIGPKNKKFV